MQKTEVVQMDVGTETKRRKINITSCFDCGSVKRYST
jgi:hypothetical protein